MQGPQPGWFRRSAWRRSRTAAEKEKILKASCAGVCLVFFILIACHIVPARLFSAHVGCELRMTKNRVKLELLSMGFTGHFGTASVHVFSTNF